MPRLILNADDFGLTPASTAPSPNSSRRRPHLRHPHGHRPRLRRRRRRRPRQPHPRRRLPHRPHRRHPRLPPRIHPHACSAPTARPSAPPCLDFLQPPPRHAASAKKTSPAKPSPRSRKLQRAGIDVTHIDTHKHTHLFPTIARPLLHVAERTAASAPSATPSSPPGPRRSPRALAPPPAGPPHRAPSPQPRFFKRIPQIPHARSSPPKAPSASPPPATSTPHPATPSSTQSSPSPPDGHLRALCHPGYK
jgi:hypothetical protein